MRFFTERPREDSSALLEVFLYETRESASHDRRPCLIICPGGAYVFCGDRDSEPNALAYMGEGYQVCVLRYSIRPTEEDPILGDAPMRDVAASIRLVRQHADEWGIDPNKIILLGVSAGGHAAASATVFWDSEEHIPGVDHALGKPNGLILCYPVITGGEYTHAQSIGNLTGKKGVCPENDAYSLEKFVRPDTCPTFIWQPVSDATVPVDNSILFAEALRKNGVPFDLHLYSHGWHGVGLATAEVGSHFPHVNSWFPLSVQWLKLIGLGPNT